MRVIKSEWHSVEKCYAIELTEDDIADVYPDMDDEEVKETYNKLKLDELSLEDFLEDAMNEGIDFDWDWLDEDDWYTDRKGGYPVTYRVEE